MAKKFRGIVAKRDLQDTDISSRVEEEIEEERQPIIVAT